MRYFYRGIFTRSSGIPSTLSGDLVATYDVLVITSGDLSGVYDINAVIVSADLAATYDVLTVTQGDLAATYDVRNLVTANLVATYQIIGGTVRGDIVAVYSVHEFPRYIAILPSDDVDLVFNKWIGTREGSEPLVWENLDSQTRYFLRTKQVDSLLSSDSELLNQLQWKDGQFSEFLPRIDSITIQPLVDPSDDDHLDAGLAREVGDKITIAETPPGFLAQKLDDYVIQNIRGEITTGPINSLKLTFGLWPAVVSSFWVAGDSELSLAGVSTRPGY